MSKVSKADQSSALVTLHDLIKPGQTVYTNLKHVSSSGMSRRISLHIEDSDGEMFDITWLAARALNENLTSDGSIRVGGCGMDMGFSLVYNLGYAMFRGSGGVPCTGSNGYTPTGRKTKVNRCQSNDHVNPGDPAYRKGRVHSDSGYAFNQVWL